MINTEQWDKYLDDIAQGRSDNQLATLAGVSSSTLSRWRSGASTPKPAVVASFARACGRNPLEALIAIGYLSPDDVQDGVVVNAPATLSEIRTLDMVEELRDRLETTSHLMQWLYAIADGRESIAQKTAESFQGVDPAKAPAATPVDKIISALAPNLATEEDGDTTYYSVPMSEGHATVTQLVIPSENELRGAANRDEDFDPEVHTDI